MRIRRPAAALVALPGLLGLLGGCSAASGAAGAPGAAAAASASPGAGATPAGRPCGTTRTGANVPVVVKVAKGTVDCATALRVENDYAGLIKSGKLQGNGGGAPVAVSGWTCQGYPTPRVLATGAASECHTASAEVIAVLALPSPPAASSSPP